VTPYVVDYHVVPERSYRSLTGIYVALALGPAGAALLRGGSTH
jgi:hypothetical protein